MGVCTLRTSMEMTVKISQLHEFVHQNLLAHDTKEIFVRRLNRSCFGAIHKRSICHWSMKVLDYNILSWSMLITRNRAASVRKAKKMERKDERPAARCHRRTPPAVPSSCGEACSIIRPDKPIQSELWLWFRSNVHR